MKEKTFRMMLLLVFGFGTLLLFSTSVNGVFAAEGGDAVITRVDTSKFPIVSAYISVSDSRGRHVAGLTRASFRVTEDGKPVSDLKVTNTAVGVQIGIILDASGSTLLKDKDGITRLDKAKIAISHLLLGYQGKHWFGAGGRTDWVSVLVPTGEESFSIAVPWTTDGGKAYNITYMYRPPQGISNTPLFKMIFSAIESFDDPKVPKGLQRSLLVFSDGVDVVSEIDLQDAVSRAQENHVKIYTVLLGNPDSKAARNLKRLSTLTNGSFYTLKNTSDLWNEITSMGNQYVLTFRSAIHSSGTHELNVSVNSSSLILQASKTFSIILQPPTVKILKPSPNTTILRKTDNPKEAFSDIEPKTLPVAIAWEWPDGHPRSIKRVDYIIGETKFPVNSPPFDRYSIDISNLLPGTYSIQAQVIDELGLVGNSDPVPVTINVVQPPTPVPESMKKVVREVVKKNNPMTPISYLALAIGLFSLALAVYLYFRKPEMVEGAIATIATTVKTVTEPFFLDKSKGPSNKEAKAYLVVLEGEETGRTIPLTSEHVRLGRDPSLVNVVFNNKTVSRLHARISQEPDGSLHIYDEGSTSGTYVNYEQVPMGGQQLFEGDIINLGQVEMKFTLHRPDAPVTDSTLPFSPEIGSPKETNGTGDKRELAGSAPDISEKDETQPFNPIIGSRGSAEESE